MIVFAKILVGVLCFTIGLNLLIRRRVFVGNAFTTQGVIVGLDVINEETRSIVVRFMTFDGMSRDAQVLTSGDYQVGQYVTVLYDPANLNDVKIQSFFEHWLVPVGFMAVGVVLLLSLLWG